MNTKSKVLLAEDDLSLGYVIKDNLADAGYDVVLCADGQAAIDKFNKESFDICLLDVMMPNKDGFAVAKKIRQQTDLIPILLITAKSLEEDRIHGFECGADDYIIKPFNMDVLVAMIDNKIKFSLNSEKSESHRFANMEHLPNTHLLLRDGRKVELTILENRILLYFLKNKNKVINREELMMEVWGYNADVNTRTLDMHIVRLRKKIEANADSPQYLQTVRGIGYKFVYAG